MSKAAVSVIVPVYNIARYLDACVASVLSQTHTRLEVILVDDGSSDESPALCDAWAQRDDRVRVIHKPNGGLSSARNAALDAAHGEYVFFVDGDDTIDPTALEDLLRRSEETGADLTLFGLRRVDEQGRMLSEEVPERAVLTCDEFWRRLYDRRRSFGSAGMSFFVVACDKLYRASLFEEERFDLGKIHEDEFILHRIIARCARIATVDVCRYNYVQHPGSIMSSSQSAKRCFDKTEALIARSCYLTEAGHPREADCALSDAVMQYERVAPRAVGSDEQERSQALRVRLNERIESSSQEGLGLGDRAKLYAFSHTPRLFGLMVRGAHAVVDRRGNQAR